jgi:plastocyanin
MKMISRNITAKKSLVFVLAMTAIVSLLLASCGDRGGGGGSAIVTYSISGQVTSGGTGLAGVTITPSAGAAVTTDASGNYAVIGLVNGSYTITPSKSDYTFTPASSTRTVANVNITGVDFTATASTPAVQVVTCPSSGFKDVTIADFSFTPALEDISVNEIVKWTNSVSTPHTVSSGSNSTKDNKFDSGTMTINQTYCVQFLAAGSYPYFCSLHPQMIGTITVE